MKLNEVLTIASVSSLLTVGGALSTWKPDPPPCDIGAESLKAMAEQEKRLYQSNEDLRLAVSKLPDGQKDLVAELEAAGRLKLRLEDKLKEAEAARKAADSRPCDAGGKPDSGLSVLLPALEAPEKKSP